MSEVADLDRIELTGLRARGYHGVLASERETGQDFVVDLVIYLDTRPAAKADDLAVTIDYRDVVARVSAVLTGDPVNLLETLAERIAATVLDAGARRVDVRVRKPDAPVAVDVEVAVAISRDDGVRAPVVDPPNVVLPAFAQPVEPAADAEPAPDHTPIPEREPTVVEAVPDYDWPPLSTGATRFLPSSDVYTPPPSPIRVSTLRAGAPLAAAGV